MKFETDSDELAEFRNEFESWEHQHPLYQFADLLPLYSPIKLWQRAGGDAALYRDYMKVVGHIIPKAG